jgi:4-hydroxy-3-polyprenylbenzoate decarboxylase
MRKRPVEVMIDEFTGLPIPIQSEIVLVGEIPPPETEKRPEGPFGEFTGYYASGKRPEPIIRVKAVYHRNNPILLGSPPLMPKGPSGYSFALSVKKREIKRRLLERGISDVLDDCTLSIPGVEVIKIKQRYQGHAAEIGSAALEVAGSRIVVLVDEDVDIRDPWHVLWAMGTRCDPENGVKVINNLKTHTLDPGLPPEKREKKDYTVSKMMIDACRPYSWAKDFPVANRCSKELRQKTLTKWKELFQGYEVKA